MARLRNFSFLYFTAIDLFLLLCTSSVAEGQSINGTSTQSQNSNRIVGWKAEPKGRGTLGILINCLITLFLCVWTTIHVNIEPQDKPQPDKNKEEKRIDRWMAKRWIRKSGWSIVSLVFPEVPLAVALFEKKTAKLLKAEMINLIKVKFREEKELIEKKKLIGEKKCEKCELGAVNRKFAQQKARWEDLALSYFVIMGGFRVPGLAEEEGGIEPQGPTENPTATQATEDTLLPHRGSSQEISPLKEISPSLVSYHELEGAHKKPPTSQGQSDKPEDKKLKMEVCTLTPRGVLFLAQQPGGFCNELLPTQVRDRSKAGTLAKVIVVFQALWMVIQVLCRTAAGLTVALLEVHVILHVLCSLYMYFVWWDKPVDIELQETVPVTKAQLEQLKSRPTLQNPTNPFNKRPKAVNTDEESQRAHKESQRTHEESQRAHKESQRTHEESQRAHNESQRAHEESQRAHKESQRVHEESQRAHEESHEESQRAHEESQRAHEESQGAHEESQGAHEESQGAQIPKEPQDRDSYLIKRSGMGRLLYIQLFNERCKFSEYFDIMHTALRRLIGSEQETRMEWLQLTLIGLVYGGAHLSTWNNRFPSNLELWMWRSASMLTAVSMGVFILTIYIGIYIGKLLDDKDGPDDQEPIPKKEDLKSKLKRYCSRAWALCIGLSIIPVLFARLYLLVECFIALRRLPADSYQTVAWAETWPHFS
ncbi:hypothetical protein EV426DRAFT_578114 [Tirmania nivea]|nr:hypothetical protein EV426DRAFT_578114 [Tirmania nivea]